MKKLKNEELGRLSVDEFKSTEKKPFIILLNNIRSLNNVGSAFRTGDAFMVKKIILTGITGQPPHRDINKTALGATDSVEWEYYADTIEAIKKLKQEGYTIASVEQVTESKMLNDFQYDSIDKVCFIFGNEVFGVDDEVIQASDLCIEIPQFGTKHSLNIAVSLGIVAWDYLSKKKLLDL